MKSIPLPLVRVNQLFTAINAFFYLAFRQEAFLLIPLLNCIFSLVYEKNLVMMLIKPFLRQAMHNYPQEDIADQRFNQTLALSMFLLAFIFNRLNIQWLSNIFASMVFIASTIALLGFCIGCFIRYHLRMFLYRKAQS